MAATSGRKFSSESDVNLGKEKDLFLQSEDLNVLPGAANLRLLEREKVLLFQKKITLILKNRFPESEDHLKEEKPFLLSRKCALHGDRFLFSSF